MPRREWVEQAADWLVAHGLHQLALRPLAGALGTSARMLVYHFGSRAKLEEAVLERLAQRWLAAVDARLVAGVPLEEVVAGLWRDTGSDPGHGRLQRLAVEIWAAGLADQVPAARPFLAVVAAGLVERVAAHLAAQGVEEPAARVRATLVVATVEGLLLLRLTDPDLPTEAALDELLGWLRTAEGAPPTGRGSRRAKAESPPAQAVLPLFG